MTDATQPTPDAPETLHIESLDHFVKILSAWHAEKVLACKHLLAVPEGSEFQVDDGNPLVLEGQAHAGFVFGVEMALMQLGELPFVAELEEEPVTG